MKDYYELAKPGIVYGNAFTTLAAFLFASQWHFGAGLFFATMFGVMCVIASACVCNNYLDRTIDGKMMRTRGRALVTGAISLHTALGYAIVLGLTGFALLLVFVNVLTAGVAFVAFIFYVVLYSIAKRTSHWGTLVGSVAGAVPIAAGYTAVTGHLDLVAVILILILVLWQMPHFYAIALHRQDDYRAAGIPVLPIAKGVRRTKGVMSAYIMAFIVATALLTLLGFTGYVYFAVTVVLGLVWLARSLQGFSVQCVDAVWAHDMFRFSLIVIVAFSVALAATPLLP